VKTYSDLEDMFVFYKKKLQPTGKIYLFIDEIQNAVGRTCHFAFGAVCAVRDLPFRFCRICRHFVQGTFKANVGTIRGKEVDFVAIKGDRKIYIQVAYANGEKKR
jgi:predicted AAA+ superfamily ATPase